MAQTADSEWQTANAQQQEAKTLNSSMQQIAALRDQLQTHFASVSNVVPFLDTIQALATAAGTETSVTNVDVLPSNSGLTVELKSTGSFQALYRLLALFENSPYELQFYTADLQKDQSPADTAESSSPSSKSATPASYTWSAIIKVNLLSFE